MTTSEEIQERCDYFNEKYSKKYRKGAIEHQGDLHRMSALELVDEGLAENYDQFSYLYEAKIKIKELEKVIEDQKWIIEELKKKVNCVV